MAAAHAAHATTSLVPAPRARSRHRRAAHTRYSSYCGPAAGTFTAFRHYVDRGRTVLVDGHWFTFAVCDRVTDVDAPISGDLASCPMCDLWLARNSSDTTLVLRV
jgi:hypothetical protein